jgi:GNAT superfamily N-acetyltransferase
MAGMSTPPHPRADGSVRRATADDAQAIADIQSKAWRQSYSTVLPPEAADAFDVDVAVAGWSAASSSPPSGRHRVLVAVDAEGVVGFAAAGPPTDDDLDPDLDAELLALHVSPDHLRAGHGSRLMAAVVDHAHDDGVVRLVTWVFAADDPMRLFLRENGWDADGATRDLDIGQLAHQVRLHTSLKDAPEATV